MPPVRRDIEVRITAPVVKEGSATLVDEYSKGVQLCKRTLTYQGRSMRENALHGQIRALYFEWRETIGNSQTYDQQWYQLAYRIINELHHILSNVHNNPVICFSDFALGKLKEESEKEKLSVIGITLERYHREMLFMSPDKDEAQRFLDSCLCDPRLNLIRKSMENYICGKTDIIDL